MAQEVLKWFHFVKSVSHRGLINISKHQKGIHI